MTLKGFEYMLLAFGVNCSGRLHGVTCCVEGPLDEATLAPPYDQDYWVQIGTGFRGDEIRQYIAAHGVTTYVAIDDLPVAISDLVQTDPTVGLTEQDADHAIGILRMSEEELVG